MSTRAKSTRKASQTAAATAAVHTTLVTEPVEANNLLSTTSSSTCDPPHRQVQPTNLPTAKSVSFAQPEAPHGRGRGRPRKEPVKAPAVAEPAPALAPALFTRPPSPSNPFFSEISSSPVDATVIALPPGPACLSSDRNHGAYFRNQSDDEYRPDDESGNEDLAEELAQIILDDDLDHGTVTASEGLTSVLQDKSGVSSASASDVWYFMTSASSSTPPDGQEKRSLGSYERPSGEFLDCYLCSLKNESRTFTNSATTAMCQHLRGVHMREWLVSCVSLKLKGWEEKAAELRKLPPQAEDSDLTRSVLAAIQPTWTLKGFLDRLIKWIVVNDQADLVVDCPEF